MNRSTFNKTIAPGLFAFAVDSFKERPEMWRSLCKVKPSKRAYEESVFFAGFGYIPEKPEGEPIVYDSMIQGPTKRWSHKTYGLNIPGLLKRNFEVIKRAISEKFLSFNFALAIG